MNASQLHTLLTQLLAATKDKPETLIPALSLGLHAFPDILGVAAETPAETPTGAPGVSMGGGTDPRINKPVIVRANKAGVYVGILAGFVDNNPDCPILLPGSRQLHYWARGGSVASLAKVGAVGEGHRFTPAAEKYAFFSAGAEVVQIVEIEGNEIYQSFMKVPVWTGQ